ncbi:MAG: nucleotidyltransferase domain-containing protein, partial [Caldiserica bacterium]
MYKLCNINIGESEEIFEELKKFVKVLKEKFKIKNIYLYGSAAKGELHEGSDIDLIIIGDFKGKMPERIKEVISLTDLPIEPLIYTEEEFNRIIK